jgi:hypothetical protein
MRRFRWIIGLAGLALLFEASLTSGQLRERIRGNSESKRSNTPTAVAETKLLMIGLNQANFDGLSRLLRKKPNDAEAWTFIRGQALLIAETGNLLLLRPPRDRQAQTEWNYRSVDLRVAATTVARAAAAQDYAGARSALADLANSCNRCHQVFQIPQRIVPFEVSEP